MAAELWTPSFEDMDNGQEAYVQYIGGVMLLHDPESPVSRGLIGKNEASLPEEAEAIIRQAEDIMYNGLRALIISASAPDYRSPIDKAEKRYEQVMPHIKNMVALACELEADRLDRINPAVTSMRPMPLSNHGIYTAICHSRREKLATRKLMGAFMPDPEFANVLDGRKMPKQRSHLLTSHNDATRTEIFY